MSSPGIGHLPQRTPPPPPKRGTGRWIASEWGLAVLALVLAVLVWAIVWGNIADERRVEHVGLRPLTSSAFVAYPEKDEITLLLEGPRRDLEEAQASLGSPAKVDVPIPDLGPDQDSERIWLSKVDQLAVPFPSRLLKGIDPVEIPVEVCRLKETKVRFVRPVVNGLPRGIDCEITLEPDSAVLRAPAHKVQPDIQPDHVDVAKEFEDRADGFLPPDATQPLTFNNWRNDPQLGRYRTGIELPPVQVTIRFFATETRGLSAPLYYWRELGLLEGYEVTISGGLAETGYYEGTFEGAADDLDRLEKERSSWWFIVRIPGEKLPADDASTDVNLKVEYVHTEALAGLRVRFRKPTVTVTIRKLP